MAPTCWSETTQCAGDRWSADPCAATGEHVGSLAYVEHGPALQKQSSNRELPAWLHSSHCRGALPVAHAWWDTEHRYPYHALPSVLLPALGLGLLVLLFLLSSEICPSPECWVALACSVWWKNQPCCFQSQRKGKDKWDSIQAFCSCAAEFKRNPQALSAEWQSCALAAAQDSYLIISYLNKCSGIRVWMLAR